MTAERDEMKKDRLVSVILTVYNEEKYIKESVESILSQTYDNIQLIIVDDGSTDGTPGILRSEYSQNERVELVFLEKNSHIAYATNAGMEHVKGSYTAIMDAGDIWVPEKLERQIAYLNENPQHAGCFTWADIIDENGEDANELFDWYKKIFECHTDTREEWLRYFFYKGNRLNNPSSLITTESMNKTGKHHPFYVQGQDMQWWVRFTKNYSFGVIEKPLVKIRRIRDDNLRTSSTNESNTARFYNECVLMRLHFFDDMDDDLFISAFQKDFVCEDSRTPLELKCEQAFLMCKPLNESKAVNAAGIIKLEELMENEESARLLRSKYAFGTAQAAKLTGTHIFNDAKLTHDADKYPEYLELCRVAEERYRLIKEQEKVIDDKHDALLKQEQAIAALNAANENLTVDKENMLAEINLLKEIIRKIDETPLLKKNAMIKEVLRNMQ